MKKRGLKWKYSRAQGEIITTVLIIILILASVIILWNIVRPMIQNSAEKIEINKFSNRLEITDSKIYINGNAKISIMNPGKQNISGINFIFYDISGKGYTIEKKDNLPKLMETRVFDISASEIKSENSLKTFSIIPVFKDDFGIETKETGGNYDNGKRVYDNPLELVGYWKFDNDVRDSAGSNDGNLLNGAKIESNYLALDGVDDYAEVPDSTSLDISKEISISFWFYPASAPSIYAVHPINKWSSTSDANFVFYYFKDSGNGYVQFWGNRAGTWDLISDVYIITSLNQWYFVTLSYSSALGGQLYVNGEKQGVLWGGGDLAVNNDNLKIGYGNGEFFNGRIDDVMIFNKALNADEVKAIYINQKK